MNLNNVVGLDLQDVSMDFDWVSRVFFAAAGSFVDMTAGILG
jgi:hypothetical protein